MKVVDRLEQHIAFGDYSYLQPIQDPSIIGCYLKSILRYMEEPLCTFEMYPLFKFLCDEMQTAKSPYDSIIKSLQEVMIQYPPVYRDTWRFVLTFLSVIADSNPKLTAHNIATVFSDILFRPTEYNSADMVLWRLFTNLLTLMITDHRRIFEVVDMKLREEKM